MLRHVMQAFVLAFALAPAIAATAPASARPVVEVAFVLDTTGSMGPLIEGAKRKIWSIALAIMDASPDAEIRMGLVAYRDIGDVYVSAANNCNPHRHRSPPTWLVISTGMLDARVAVTPLRARAIWSLT